MERQKLFSVNGRDPKQCRWEYFIAPGKGGQKRNRCRSAARVTHIPSGATGQAVESRSQIKNKRAAFKRMGESEKFKRWVKLEAARKTGEAIDIERKVKEAMRHIKIECVQNGKWQECPELGG